MATDPPCCPTGRRGFLRDLEITPRKGRAGLIASDARKHLGKRNLKTLCNQGEIEDRNVSLSPLNISQKTPINADSLRQFHLGPATFRSQRAYSAA